MFLVLTSLNEMKLFPHLGIYKWGLQIFKSQAQKRPYSGQALSQDFVRDIVIQFNLPHPILQLFTQSLKLIR